jgi:hypothetical protein
LQKIEEKIIKQYRATRLKRARRERETGRLLLLIGKAQKTNLMSRL